MAITTAYRVLTPHGGFEAQWDEDEEVPVAYVGNEDAIAFFKSVLDLNPISARGGALVQFAALQPDDIAFCQRPEYGVTVIEPIDDLLDDDAATGDDSDMIFNGRKANGPAETVPPATNYDSGGGARPEAS